MIVVDNVSKYYGAHCAVRDLSFEIGEGECIGFLGLNGAGKSTTLRLLACLLLPTSGRITVRGLDVVESPHAIRRFIGYLPDTPPLYGEMTVREYLLFAGTLRGLSGSDLNARYEKVVAQCALADMRDNPISTLSHGYRQRVGIAQAIIHGPSLLILDEPIQGLDPVQIVEMRNMIAALRGEHTILLSTHILSEIERTCDRILMMHGGRIAAQGSEETLAAQLSSGRALELEVRGEEQALRGALAPLCDASSVSVKRTDNGTLRATVRNIDENAREQVSAAVVRSGLGLLAMQTATTDLEAIFLELSGARAGEAGPAASASATATASALGGTP
jgi:ABC-2 type transport system ATP-binding protein